MTESTASASAPYLYDYFDRVVLINLDRRDDRLRRVRKEIMAADWPFKSPERFRAIDASRLPVPIGWQSGGGAWGCMQSHRQVLERALLDGIQSILVIEDDVTFRPDFGAKVAEFLANVPMDWDQLMIGGQHFRHSIRKQVAPGIVQVIDCQRTHCYALRGNALRELYRKWSASFGHCDHVMGPWQAGFKVYAPDPYLAGQADGRSDISGANNPTKYWDSPKYGAPVFWMKCSRKTVEALRNRGLHGGRTRNADGVDVGIEAIIRETSQPKQIHALSEWLTMIEWEGRSQTPECFAMIYGELPMDVVREAVGERLILVHSEDPDQVLRTIAEHIISMKEAA